MHCRAQSHQFAVRLIFHLQSFSFFNQLPSYVLKFGTAFSLLRRDRLALICRHGTHVLGRRKAERGREGTTNAAMSKKRNIDVLHLSVYAIHQNKKYRCAIGNTVAGSQVSSTPSARTS